MPWLGGRKGTSRWRGRLIALNPARASAREFILDKAHIRVGSGDGNDFVLSDSTASRRHAVIQLRWRGFVVADLGSTNGTFVNNQRINEPVRLRLGDNIRFGDARFTFSDAASAAPAFGRQLDNRLRRRPLRTMIEIVLLLFAIGFAAGQVLLYLHYREQAERLGNEKPAGAPPATLAPGAPPAAVPTPAVRPSKMRPAEASARSDEAPQVVAEWLTRVNQYRAIAGVAPLIEDLALTEGARKHARHLIEDYARRGMQADGAIFLIPRRPLEHGRKYKASIAANGRQYDWSFKAQ